MCVVVSSKSYAKIQELMSKIMLIIYKVYSFYTKDKTNNVFTLFMKLPYSIQSSGEKVLLS